MSERAEHGRTIATIRKVTGRVDRRLSFKEAHEWAFAYESEVSIGYDPQTVAQRSYDCLMSSRRGLR